ncbi:MAG: hypothetical protein EPN38_00910 [Rhodanobacteraceae bacterium]|nr:MAG: hypothetical protein EPN38_00910 [Rhodanobacteraceae bacterium]
MTALTQLRKLDNLRRAWRWIQSNADASYKSYFRSLYQHFAAAEDALLNDVADRLKRGIYDPDPATKILFPKPSGVLRPYSLLSVEDQIVYQAAVNLVAERLFPKVRQRYLKSVFGHLYAGKSSAWFYRKWSAGYKAYNDTTRKAVDDRFIYGASFDLTACYDSLDHSVLRHFLARLGFEPDFCRKLTDWLGTWAATDKGIFHSHGIPQGPLSSGLLSEVVLSYFDDLNVKHSEFRYLRYVDDIRLFARDEHTLRRLLVALDRKSKDIGLFPQGSKIDIHRVTSIDEELKTVSNPPEPSISFRLVDQKRLLARLRELTPRHRIANPTRFKYLLANAQPSAKLTERLWKVLERHPEVYRNICRYLSRYGKLPRVAAEHVVVTIKNSDLYQSVCAEFISAADGRLPQTQDRALTKYLKGLWAPKSMQADLMVAAGLFLIRAGALTDGQIRYACKVAPSWWVRAKLIEATNGKTVSLATSQSVVDTGVHDVRGVPALAAAWIGFQIDHVPSGRRRDWNKRAALMLREVGLIRRSTAKFCGIQHSLSKLDRTIAILNWRCLFGRDYKYAELQIVEAVAASKVNITSFVNLLDVFNDRLLDALFHADGGIGKYNLGHIGSALGSASSKFATKYPMTYKLASEVHQRRFESMGSHPVVRNSGRPTGKIPFRFLARSRRLLVAAVSELARSDIAP